MGFAARGAAAARVTNVRRSTRLSLQHPAGKEQTARGYHVPMATQSYSNHTRTDPVYHRALLPILLLTIIGACVNVYESWGDHERIYSASLILVLTLCLSVAAVLARVYALKAQDRAIRAEENFRHYVLTGKPLDARLGIRQVVALRFASDSEFPALASRAASEGLQPGDIKQAVKDWRADEYRV